MRPAWKHFLQGCVSALISGWFALCILALAQLSAYNDPKVPRLGLLYEVACVAFAGLAIWRFILFFKD